MCLFAHFMDKEIMDDGPRTPPSVREQKKRPLRQEYEKKIGKNREG